MAEMEVKDVYYGDQYFKIKSINMEYTQTTSHNFTFIYKIK